MIVWNVKVPSQRTDALVMDVYASDSNTPRGALLFLHGGGFTHGNKEQFLGICSALALKTGWLCASLSYQLAGPDAAFPTQIMDVYDAVHLLVKNRIHWMIDINSIVLAGGSPGGCIAAISALYPDNMAEYDPVMDRTLRSVILLNGIINLHNFLLDNPDEIGNLCAFMPYQALWKSMSPHVLMARRSAGKRFLFIHGNNDKVVRPDDVRLAVDVINHAQGQAMAIFLSGEEHGWFNLPEKQPLILDLIAEYIMMKEGFFHGTRGHECIVPLCDEGAVYGRSI